MRRGRPDSLEPRAPLAVRLGGIEQDRRNPAPLQAFESVGQPRCGLDDEGIRKGPGEHGKRGPSVGRIGPDHENSRRDGTHG